MQPNSKSPPLEIKNLCKEYGQLKAVSNVSLTLEPGEVFGLLGPNGAGKTSIISVIVTLEQPTAGSVQVFGHDVVSDSLTSRRLVGVVPQEVINQGFFDIEEILHFQSGYYGISRNDKQISFLLDRLSLTEHRHKKIRQLSGGMKRRLMIAKALVHRPRLLLLDEPTAGVDIELRANIWQFVEELRRGGTTVLLTTHYLEEAEHLCDRVGILCKGQILRIDETKSLVKQLTQRKLVIQLKTPSATLQHANLVSQTDLSIEFRLPANKGLGEVIAESGLEMKNIADIHIEEGRLEDAFRAVLGVNI